MTRCRSCVVRSELAFAVELHVLQWICGSLTKLSFYIKLTFAAKTVSAAANDHSLPKLSCLQWNCESLLMLCRLQRVNIRCRIVFCSEFVTRCRSCVIRSELTVVAEWRVIQRICDSLTKLSFCSQLTFAVETELSAAKLLIAADDVLSATI